jgi:hypothetical protein
MKNTFLNKIPLRPLIEELITVYNDGADYIDASIDIKRGMIIRVKEEYINMLEEDADRGLTQEDIDKLMKA